MPKFYPSIPADLAEWASKQPLFFTASAPLSGQHINISPKGLPSSTFTIFSPTQCAYIDATGSGSETISHVYENGRVTIMFCSFGPSPRILRFFCRATIVEWDVPEFETLLARMQKKRIDGARAAVLLDVFKVQTSCGYGVPRFLPIGARDPEKASEAEAAFQDRETLGHWASKKVETNEMQTYQMQWNAKSLDGLPGLRSARRALGERLWLSDRTARLSRVWVQKEALLFGLVLGILLSWVVGRGMVVITTLMEDFSSDWA